jgi:feruloyl-CoA synthase
VVKHPAVVDCLKRGLQAHNASTAGATSMRVARAMLMVEPPSIDGNELTDKGYINQRAGLERRAALVEALRREPGRGRGHPELIVGWVERSETHHAQPNI